MIEGDAWDPDKFDWLDTLIAYRKHGFSHDLFMDLSVTPDFRNNTRHVIDVSDDEAGRESLTREQLDQASLGMPDRSYLLRGLNDSAVAGYYKLMVESAVMLGATRSRAEKEMLDGKCSDEGKDQGLTRSSHTTHTHTRSPVLRDDSRQRESCLRHPLRLSAAVAQFSLPREERRNISLLYNKMTVSEMSSLAPNVSARPPVASWLVRDDPD